MQPISLQVRQAPRHRAGGFTLIELSVVLFILTLLFAGALTPLTQQLAERQNTQTRRNLEAVQSALIGYALSHRDADGHPYLPCPDLRQPLAGGTANDGREDRKPDGGCLGPTGNSPWISLGVPETDAWGNHFTYAVSPAYAHSGHGMSLRPASQAELRICLDRDCATHMQAAAVLISHGRNGLGAINQIGRMNQAATAADEQENTDGDLRFVYRPPAALGRPGGEFDDLGLVLSAEYLLGRLCGPEMGC
ncbi:MAG TPA: type II secretion system protein [Thiobacillaceae bacterium]|nr:type II secretion system protein [Thiobacillaceae bacterium]